jgi:hypothetical protein
MSGRTVEGEEEAEGCGRKGRKGFKGGCRMCGGSVHMWARYYTIRSTIRQSTHVRMYVYIYTVVTPYAIRTFMASNLHAYCHFDSHGNDVTNRTTKWIYGAT